MRNSLIYILSLFFGVMVFLSLPQKVAAVSSVSNLAASDRCDGDHNSINLNWTAPADFNPSTQVYVVFKIDTNDNVTRGLGLSDNNGTATSRFDWSYSYDVRYYTYQVVVVNTSTGQQSPIAQTALYTQACHRPTVSLPFYITTAGYTGSLTACTGNPSRPQLNLLLSEPVDWNYFEVYRIRQDQQGGWVRVWAGERQPNVINTSISDSSVQAGVLYTYMVLGYDTFNPDWQHHPVVAYHLVNETDDTGASVYLTNYSGFKTAPNCSVPQAPNAFLSRNSCTGGVPNVELYWGAQANVYYNIVRNDPDGQARGLGNTTNGGIVDGGLFPNTGYSYEVRAVNTFNNLASSPSTVSLTTQSCN